MTGHVLLCLLCLLTCIPGGMLLTEDQLVRVTEYIKENITSGYFNFQHAYAVKFTSKECRHLRTEDIERALCQEDIEFLRETVRDFEIYEGTRMVAASFSRSKPTVHAEYRLLNGERRRVSPVEDLMNARPKGECVVFFTLYSPCLSRCLETKEHFNIVDALSVFDKVNKDQRAFVFRNVYSDDLKRTENEIWDAWRELDKEIPLFRCKNDKCHRCFTKPVGGRKSLLNKECNN